MKRRAFLACLTLLAAGAAAGPPVTAVHPALTGPLPNFGPHYHIEAVWREGSTAVLRVRFQSHTFMLKSREGRYWHTV